MTTKTQLDRAASLIHEAKLILDQVEPLITNENDLKILKRTKIDLNWANENCTVIGLHSTGEALDDLMGEEG